MSNAASHLDFSLPGITFEKENINPIQCLELLSAFPHLKLPQIDGLSSIVAVYLTPVMKASKTISNICFIVFKHQKCIHLKEGTFVGVPV